MNHPLTVSYAHSANMALNGSAPISLSQYYVRGLAEITFYEAKKDDDDFETCIARFHIKPKVNTHKMLLELCERQDLIRRLIS